MSSILEDSSFYYTAPVIIKTKPLYLSCVKFDVDSILLIENKREKNLENIFIASSYFF